MTPDELPNLPSQLGEGWRAIISVCRDKDSSPLSIEDSKIDSILTDLQYVTIPPIGNSGSFNGDDDVKRDYLVEFHGDYADEFDVYGFQLFKYDEWETKEKVIKELFRTAEALRENQYHDDVEVYFGTNEYMGFGSFDAWRGDVKVHKIHSSEAEVISRLFPKSNHTTLVHGVS